MAEQADNAERELDPMGALVEALAKAQGAYPRIDKNRTGEVRGNKNGRDYAYTYNYADLGDVLAAVRPVLSENGLALVQRTKYVDGKLVLVTELRHRAGGLIDSVVELGQSPGAPQQFGGALTYLRRYEAGTLLGVAPEEDTDARDVTPAGATPPPAPLPPWATDLNRERLAGELGPRLKVLLGDEGAKAAARVIKDNLGGIPAIVSMTAGLIVDTMLADNLDELVVRLDEEQLRRRQAAAQAEVAAAEAAAQAEAEAAQAAAEAPDAPAPADEADVPAEEAQTPAEAARAAAAAVDEQRAEEAPADETPPAGRTRRPDLAGLSADEAAAAMRAAGCICPDPLKADTDEGVRVDTCPMMGHGIPF